ncbi:hypothetical protein FNV58_00890 (plasmid) [Streptomyces sp. RLB1-9]|uniref:hypothetical protein n=1 Tax=Streptomyces sp. RLB1-9 TaxID=2594454 RepID=UPI00116295BA|nr:hypothetical protein [Streptomyces sp. RLB1-9]QDN94916.1 hypothetical protein FNV58_00890 [Streptomyces sp. RLB1-9]
MKPLSEPDYQLSMRTSPRARADERNQGLRSLLVHRLRDAAKAVVRLPNRTSIATAHSGRYTVHCETDNIWFGLPDWGEEIECPGECGQIFALEFAVFSAVPAPAAGAAEG